MKKNLKEKNKKTPVREVLEWILAIAAALVICLPVRAFGFELMRVEGSSMEGTLSDGEIMFVSKFDYASSWLALPWQDDETKESAPRLVTGGAPERFDVVACRYPGRGGTVFVKRVVGLPGDVVELKNGYLYVNREKYDEPYVKDEYRAGGLNDFGPVTVPEGRFFVLGDHRNNSNDSRYVGAISRDMILGHARAVVFPFAGVRGIGSP